MTTAKTQSTHTRPTMSPASFDAQHIQTGLDRFGSLRTAWEWHIGIGLGVELEMLHPLDTETRKHVLEAFNATNVHPSKRYRIFRTVREGRLNPIWEAVLFEMTRWAMENSVIPANSGYRLAASTALLSDVRNLVRATARHDSGRNLLRAFLRYLWVGFPWLQEEWQFPDPTSARRRWLRAQGYRPASWFKALGIAPECVRSAWKRLPIRSRISNRRREYLTSDVSKYAPQEFRLDVLQTTFGPEFPSVAALPISRP